MGCCKGNFCPAEDIRIRLVVPHWGYEAGDSSVNWLEDEQKQWLLQHNYAVLDYENKINCS